jgi:hypothetical protein
MPKMSSIGRLGLGSMNLEGRTFATVVFTSVVYLIYSI